RAARAWRGEVELGRAGVRRRFPSAVGHRERDAYHDCNDYDRCADRYEQSTLPGLPRLARPHLSDLRPGDVAVPARLGHLFRSSLPGQTTVQPASPAALATEPIGRSDRAIPAGTYT